MAKYRLLAHPDGTYSIAGSLQVGDLVVGRSARKRFEKDQLEAMAIAVAKDIAAERVKHGLTEVGTGEPGVTG